MGWASSAMAAVGCRLVASAPVRPPQQSGRGYNRWVEDGGEQVADLRNRQRDRVAAPGRRWGRLAGSEPLRIPLDRFRTAFELAPRHVEASAGSTVALEHDYFWSVPGDALYDVPDEPKTITIGQLSESWQHLEDLLADPNRAVDRHLVRLADVLRAIGQGTAQQPPHVRHDVERRG
ncbi:hypothetical protein [Streptomyces sp. NPDC058861]|uniref:hypothetical protein n=1 Tax=Streptomyces sp. NPDC058861 TaxID=3346653 RepID=UPI0036ADF653